jgi:exonuclease III
MTDDTDDTDGSNNNNESVNQAFRDLKFKHSDNMVIAYLNINSYRYKACDILDTLNKQLVDIVCISETKLDQSFPDTQFQAENYVLYRKDGSSAYSGGLIVYATSTISTRRRTDLERPDLEFIVLELIHDKTKSFYYICYRAPRIDVNSYLSALSNSMDRESLNRIK